MLKKTGLLLIGLILALVFGEISVRLMRGKLFDARLLTAEYRASESGLAQPAALYDPTLGWIPNPGRRVIGGATFTIEEGNVRSNGSSATFEGRPILVVGDSFAFGDEVDDGDSWPARLEQKLQRKVINAAVFGYGLDQVILRAEQLVPKYQPALTIVSFIPDDVNRCGMSVRQWPKPYFELVDDSLVLRNVPVPNELRREISGFRRIAGYSHLADLVMRRIDQEYWLDTPIELTSKTPWQALDSSPTRKIARALIRRLAKLQSDDHKILLVAQHTKYLGPQDHEISTELVECGREAGIAVLDLFDFLLALREKSAEEFLALYHHHMYAPGNELVAGEIAAAIAESKL